MRTYGIAFCQTFMTVYGCDLGLEAFDRAHIDEYLWQQVVGTMLRILLS